MSRPLIPGRLRWKMADYLSRIACWLRGHKWYVADAYAGVPGNRVNELHSQIREQFILRIDVINDADQLEFVESKLDELAQMAGENWGHIWPKGER